MTIRFLAVVSAAVALGACATSATIASRPLDAGTMKEFAAPAPKVAAAAKTTIAALSYTLESETQNGPSTLLQFSKSLTAFSWGEVGRVVITPAGDAAARVYVDTEKRSQMQITGTSEAQFSQKIFDGITAELAK